MTTPWPSRFLLHLHPSDRAVATLLAISVVLAAVVALSWAGSKQFEGQGYIGYGWDQLSVAVVALAFFYWGVHSGWQTPALAGIKKPE